MSTLSSCDVDDCKVATAAATTAVAALTDAHCCSSKEEEDDDDGRKNHHYQHKRLARNHLRPNAELTDQEKDEKRGLKRLLRRQTRRRSLVVRLQQALQRRDATTEAKTRLDLAEFMKAEEKEVLKTSPVFLNGPATSVSVSLPAESVEEQDDNNNNNNHCNNNANNNDKAKLSRQREATARFEIEQLYQTFYLTIKRQQQQQQVHTSVPTTSTSGASISNGKVAVKEEQTAQARLLLRSMTKGTQTEHMFENYNALVGYTRQKFQERACLAISSLSKLDPARRWGNTTLTTTTTTTREEQYSSNDSIKEKMWNRLTMTTKTTGSIRSICSIGCGPGCDGTGLLKFLEHFTDWNKHEKEPLVDRVLFLDWTMDRWGEHFLEPLRDILQNQAFIRTAHLEICNVLQPLSGASNAKTRQLLVGDSQEDLCHVDLFVTSYLLTETRDKWCAFYGDLVQIAKPGTLFLFAEPKAWQLHTFIEQTRASIDFVWLDSSMNSPILQALEGRVGPAVLLGMKK